jgi:hypothetical protein
MQHNGLAFRLNEIVRDEPALHRPRLRRPPLADRVNHSAEEGDLDVVRGVSEFTASLFAGYSNVDFASDKNCAHLSFSFRSFTGSAQSLVGLAPDPGKSLFEALGAYRNRVRIGRHRLAV